jgi:methylated-DNA-[protein]-cysteine S-methyltransferase
MDKLTMLSTQTPDGPFHLIIDQDAITRVSGFGDKDELLLRLPESLQIAPITSATTHPYIELIDAYYHGDKTALDKIPRQQEGSDFQRAVWQTISTIPYGETVSYKELATISGKPAAVRAAGTICGRNRLILLVPCHRVLKSDGSIGSYLYGPQIKDALLRREGSLL